MLKRVKHYERMKELNRGRGLWVCGGVLSENCIIGKTLNKVLKEVSCVWRKSSRQLGQPQGMSMLRSEPERGWVAGEERGLGEQYKDFGFSSAGF